MYVCMFVNECVSMSECVYTCVSQCVYVSNKFRVYLLLCNYDISEIKGSHDCPFPFHL